MAENREPLWTIHELGSQVALALAENYAGQQNGSVRDVPDLRTIRYYTTLGLLDRPARMRGRTALYGRRHLLQLVAIKRLQTRGLTLEEVQRKLLGLPDAALQRLAQVPAALLTDGETNGAADAEAPRADFWRQPPVPYTPPSEPPPDGAPPAQAVPLAAGVLLVLEADRPLEEDDVEAIRVAAGPLLKLLEKRRLTGSGRERSTS